ncbi:MAG: methylmalonyl-CoA mutase family protein, partial [Janthinobacterium lividum]
MHPTPAAPYKLKNHVRIVTAAALFDGHDAAINIMRRIIQSSGAEVIHLGHNRSVQEIVDCAIQEDAQAIAITSYQGGHNEYFKYMFDLLKERGAGHIKIFGGGGGVILPSEIAELQGYGITRLYSPDDGRSMGLQGMINHLLEESDYPTGQKLNGEVSHIKEKDARSIGRLISAAENFPEEFERVKGQLVAEFQQQESDSSQLLTPGKTQGAPILGITGTGGAGKSSLVDELVRRFLLDFPEKTLAIISVDPSKRKTGGALLGDRIRMNAINSPRVYMRSLATRQSNLALSRYVQDAVDVVKAADFDLIILETSGIGQSDTEIIEHSDVSLYVMTPEYGAATQLEKIDMLDFADVIALNKFDKRGGLDALRDVRKQYQRNHQKWDSPLDEMPVFGTIASQFNDPGMNRLYRAILRTLEEKTGAQFASHLETSAEQSEKVYIIPPNRTRYLSEIAETNRAYDKRVSEQVAIAEVAGSFATLAKHYGAADSADATAQDFAKNVQTQLRRLDADAQALLENWDDTLQNYRNPEYVYKVRDKEIRVKTHTISLSGNAIPKVAVPRYLGWGDRLRWAMQENFPGEFPYTAGVFPFKREGEDPTRMFAGEGGPERTNRRFHYVSKGLPAKRLSTAFDSVTLYGEDPDHRPDIYGKIGNAGVSIACLDDAKKLYSGFDLSHPATSVSMTINGPAATLAAFFMNAAIDQNCEKYIHQNGLEAEVDAKIDTIFATKQQPRPRYQGELPDGNNGLGLLLLGVTGEDVLPAEVYQQIKATTLTQVRGTVQADILKEDQAQNTCIFSTEFALRLMGDVQEYFITEKVRNFYSVSISGYHIAEAGANPITQLALTLSNGFTFVEYYVSRGMNVNDFAPNLSFFFSNGIDPEYAVIGRVARRIWAKAMKLKYGANARSQMLKYHIQTSGRSL